MVINYWCYMRKGKVTHISKFIEKFLLQNSIDSDGYALRVFFSDFIGPKLAKYSEIVKISKETVFVTVKSPVVKNEILILRRKIIKAVNQFLCTNKIKNLKIIQE